MQKWIIMTVALTVSVTLLTSCAGYRPVVIGPGYLGVGAYRDHRKVERGAPPHIDLDGVGVLLLYDRVVIGYSEVARVYRSKQLQNARLRLSRTELAFGEAADTMALEMAEGWDQKKIKGDRR